MSKAIVLSICAALSSACIFANSGAKMPNDEVHRHLASGAPYPVLPQPISTANNAFITPDLQKSIPELSGNNMPLIETLADFAAKNPQAGGDEGLCYWTWQALPPPRGDGPSLQHPTRSYWDVESGTNDQDIQWVQAYGDVATARLHSRVKKGGPVMAAISTIGARLARRRCSPDYPREFSPAGEGKCVDAITKATLQWPMAISIWKVGHPDLNSAVEDWRGNSQTGHVPNIEWVIHSPDFSGPARPWSAPMPQNGEIMPGAMEEVPFGKWPGSQTGGWGAPKIAKVVRCSDIPSKYKYNTDSDDYIGDKISDDSDGAQTVADEAYALWKDLEGVWPPTKPCADDQAGLDTAMAKVGMPQLVGVSCTAAFDALQTSMPNFDCDNSDPLPQFRDVCCSVCGNRPLPDVPTENQPNANAQPAGGAGWGRVLWGPPVEPPVPVPVPAPVPVLRPTKPEQPAVNHQCMICNHVYDAERDGNGMAFEDLPDTWRCPTCGAPKSAYFATETGLYVHDH